MFSDRLKIFALCVLSWMIGILLLVTIKNQDQIVVLWCMFFYMVTISITMETRSTRTNNVVNCMHVGLSLPLAIAFAISAGIGGHYGILTIMALAIAELIASQCIIVLALRMDTTIGEAQKHIAASILRCCQQYWPTKVRQ